MTANNINNILFGMATNLLGIIVTVSFVQFFIDKQNHDVAISYLQSPYVSHKSTASL